MVLDPVWYDFEVEGTNDPWRVRHFTLTERLSGLYSCWLDLRHPEANGDPEALLGSSCTLSLSRGAGVERRVCGVICRVLRCGGQAGYVVVRAEIRPALWALGQSTNSRIFQHMTAVEIIQRVLSDGLAPYDRRLRLDLLRQDYAQREYCVQYHETDLAFVQRLMQEEGISFYFDHSGKAEELVLVDANARFPECDSLTGACLPLVPRDSGAPDVEVLHTLVPAYALTPTGVILHEYDWLRPALPVHHEVLGRDRQQRARVEYDCEPALCLDANSDDGTARRQIRHEEQEIDGWVVTGEANVLGMMPGHVFELEDRSGSGYDGMYLLTEVTHDGSSPDELAGAGEDESEYSNRFVCIPADVPFRPRRSIERPKVGTQTATVVGPAGEEVYTDEHGRVKVQFHWDREGQSNECSSCWIRVAQSWAGGGFGVLFIPRIGMEVLVQFLDSNADRPVVVGCLYNGSSPAAYSLPQEKTKSTITTRSSPGGLGYNEIAFEDASDHEEIALHAQKDLSVKVLNDHTSSIDHDESVTISHDQQIQIGNDRSVSVGHDDSLTVTNCRKVSVGANAQVSIGGNHTEQVGGGQQLSVGGNRSQSVGGQEQVKIGGSRNEIVGGSDTHTIAAAHMRTVGVSEQVTVGTNQSTKVGGIKTENVGGLSLENVGGAKTLSIGGAYAITVGAAMNTGVIGASFEEVGLIKMVKVGTKLEFSCGSSKIVLEKGGKVTIEGTEFAFKASGQVKIEGGKIDLN